MKGYSIKETCLLVNCTKAPLLMIGMGLDAEEATKRAARLINNLVVC
jgi:hypothetical protein